MVVATIDSRGLIRGFSFFSHLKYKQTLNKINRLSHLELKTRNVDNIV